MNKIESLQELVFKTLAIKHLITRNQEKDEIESALKKRKSSQLNEKKPSKKLNTGKAASKNQQQLEESTPTQENQDRI